MHLMEPDGVLKYASRLQMHPDLENRGPGSKAPPFRLEVALKLGGQKLASIVPAWVQQSTYSRTHDKELSCLPDDNSSFRQKAFYVPNGILAVMENTRGEHGISFGLQ